MRVAVGWGKKMGLDSIGMGGADSGSRVMGEWLDKGNPAVRSRDRSALIPIDAGPRVRAFVEVQKHNC